MTPPADPREGLVRKHLAAAMSVPRHAAPDGHARTDMQGVCG